MVRPVLLCVMHSTPCCHTAPAQRCLHQHTWGRSTQRCQLVCRRNPVEGGLEGGLGHFEGMGQAYLDKASQNGGPLDASNPKETCARWST